MQLVFWSLFVLDLVFVEFPQLRFALHFLATAEALCMSATVARLDPAATSWTSATELTAYWPLGGDLQYRRGGRCQAKGVCALHISTSPLFEGLQRFLPPSPHGQLSYRSASNLPLGSAESLVFSENGPHKHVQENGQCHRSILFGYRRRCFCCCS